MTSNTYAVRLGLQQRVFPSYRIAFIEALAQACEGGLSVFAGHPLEFEGIDPAEGVQFAQLVHAKNRYFRDPSSPIFLCWQGGILHWLDQSQPEVLIIEANPRYLSTCLALSWMHRRGRKVIGWGLGAPPISGLLGGFRQWERLSFLRHLDAIVAYSQQGAKQYRTLSIATQRVYVASNAVSPAPTIPPPQRPLKFNGNAVVLFVGRLQSRKRVDLLLRACAALPQEIQPRVVIVGDGPAQAEFEHIAQEVYPDAEFVGAKHGAQVEPYFVKADLFVLPGTGGLAIQQAMGYGLPIIVARGDGTQDDLVRPENGWQVPPDDLPSLTDALREALSNPEQLRQKGEASYHIVAEEINVNKMVEVFIQVINDLKKT